MAYVNKTQTRTSRLVIGSVFNEQGDDSSFRVLVYNYKNTPIQSASILLKSSNSVAVSQGNEKRVPISLE